MRIIYDNIVFNSEISVTSENVDYPASNLQDQRMSKIYRTLADDAQRITFHLAGSSASYLFIWNHNISSGATITLQGNDTDAWGAPSLSESVTWDADLIVLSFTEDTYNYWSLYIDDPANPDNYLSIGLIYLATYLQMPGMEPKQQMPYHTNSKNKFSDSGQVYGDIRRNYREAKINFPNVTETLRQSIKTMFDTVVNVKTIVLLIWADDLDFEAPMYCVINDNKLPWKKSDSRENNFPWAVTISFREVF